MNITKTFLSFSLLGADWVLWLLIILSVIGVGIMIERGVFFRRRLMKVELILPDLKRFLEQRDLEGARKRLESNGRVDSLIVASVLGHVEQGTSAVEEAFEEGIAALRPQLEQGLAFLATVGNNAPFLGLFGTVLGIIRAFHDLSQNTQGGASTVMVGISEALVATAVGILVAVPAVAMYNYFQRQVKLTIGNMNLIRHAVLATMKSSAPDKQDR